MEVKEKQKHFRNHVMQLEQTQKSRILYFLILPNTDTKMVKQQDKHPRHKQQSERKNNNKVQHILV
jgi:hypothetical protein